MIKHILQVALLFAVFSSCNTMRVVKPIEKGETQIGFDLGGPVVNGALLPLVGAHYAKGHSEKLSYFAGFQGTTMGFLTLQNDFGLTYLLNPQKNFIPGISVSPVLNTLIGFRDGSFRLYPELSASAFWEIKKQHLLYFGTTNWFDISYGESEFNRGRLLHPALQAGYQVNIKRFNVRAECKWLNYNKELLIPQATINTIGQNGGLGFYLSFNYSFLKKNQGI